MIGQCILKTGCFFLKSDRASRLGDFNVVLLTSFLEWRLIDNNESIIQIGNSELIDIAMDIAIMKFNVN